MEKHEMIRYLLKKIEYPESEDEDSIRISKADAAEIVRMLSGREEVPEIAAAENGKIPFYCPDCGKSFLAEGREDPSCYEKWHYRSWTAVCPECRREVSRNDRYWR